MLQVQRLGFSHPHRPVFDDLSFDIAPQTMLYLKGRNGSGKTTLLRLLAGLLWPQKGKVIWNQKSIQIQFCPLQQRGLMSHLRVDENLLLKSHWHGHRPANSPLTNEVANLYPHQLSSGMRQKVHIVGALTRAANVHLLDEPFSSLDSRHWQEVMELMISTLNLHRGILIFSGQDARWGEHLQQILSAQQPHLSFRILEIG